LERINLLAEGDFLKEDIEVRKVRSRFKRNPETDELIEDGWRLKKKNREREGFFVL
jgi:hypothetical protein